MVFVPRGLFFARLLQIYHDIVITFKKHISWTLTSSVAYKYMYIT